VVLFAVGHSLTAGIVTLVVFLIYTQLENHALNPLVMSRTVKVNPLLVLIAILVGASLGDWIGGVFGAFVAALLAIPAAGAIQVMIREVWQSTAPPDLATVPGDGAVGEPKPGDESGEARPPSDAARPGETARPGGTGLRGEAQPPDDAGGPPA
jgi:hypothetical protein